MSAVTFVRARKGGTCAREFFHPNQISPGDIVAVTTHFPSDETVRDFGAPPFTRTRACEWCVIRDALHDAHRNEWGLHRFKDRHGDLWVFGADGLMHTPETAPFPYEHVKRKWGPLRIIDMEGVRPAVSHPNGRSGDEGN